MRQYIIQEHITQCETLDYIKTAFLLNASFVKYWSRSISPCSSPSTMHYERLSLQLVMWMSYSSFPKLQLCNKDDHYHDTLYYNNDQSSYIAWL